MRFIEITYNNIKTEVERFLSSRYKKTDVNFSPASPYGQILEVIERMYQNGFFYLKSSIDNLNLLNRNSNVESIIRTNAILSGYIPYRAISASGTIKLKVKSAIDLEESVPGQKFTISDKSLLRNKTNGLFYSLNLSTDSVTYSIKNGGEYFFEIVQGEWRKARLTGSGDINQTFQVLEKRGVSIENFNLKLSVNGERWDIRKNIREMGPREKSAVIRTGLSGGIDIIFGNSSFGEIPPLGSLIEIDYIATNGADGNIFRRTPDDFIFIDSPVDGFGTSIDVNSVFDVLIETDINFGAGEESATFIKNLLPVSSNNYVLALPEQYSFFIKRLGVFSHVNAWEEGGVVYIVATPNIKSFSNRNLNYFLAPESSFILDDEEIVKIDRYLKLSGNIQLTKKYKISSPKLSKYIMNIFIIKGVEYPDDKINSQIIDAVSEYFLDLNLKDLNRIPKSDIISLISDIEGIESVDVQFISKKNEDYHRQFIEDTNNFEYDRDSTPGLDPVLGDIIFEDGEVPLIRGGWYDRNRIFLTNSIDSGSIRTINIIKR